MSIGIIKIIDNQFSQYINDECLDIIQIKNICNLYKTKSTNMSSISLDEIDFSSPKFLINKKQKISNRQTDILKSEEFINKYTFFIRTIYACLKIGIEIFDLNEDILTLKNNYFLLKSLESGKKKLINEHINLLKIQYKNISKKVTKEYYDYYSNYIMKIEIIDNIYSSLFKLLDYEVVHKADNLLTLILPYFYNYTDYIEEYNG